MYCFGMKIKLLLICRATVGIQFMFKVPVLCLSYQLATSDV